jgi:hypothetical protein
MNADGAADAGGVHVAFGCDDFAFDVKDNL